MSRNTIIIGVTGGMGCGKSEVLRYLEEAWSARAIRLDDVSRRLLDPGNEGFDKAVSIFGDEIIKEDGTLDRSMIAGIIFTDDKKRIALNNYIHPAVRQKTEQAIEQAKEDGVRFFIIEAALLIENHYDAICDELWYIYADESTRISRLTASRGYSIERIRNTMKNQLSEDEFRKACSVTIDNSGSFEQTAEAIDGRMNFLLRSTL